MIVSASYKTDIPTFYGEWFVRRLRAGFCKMANPYNRKSYTVRLDRDSVDGFVFWTKNAHPFLSKLEEVRELGFPFVVQYTINGYPRALESQVVDPERSITTAHRIRDCFGPRAVVWRYDTIVMSSLTPFEFHVENFRRLASELVGATDEVVVSFAQVYKKTKRNLDQAAERAGFRWGDPRPEEKQRLLRVLLSISREQRMTLTVCSQRDLLVDGARDARCVDADRLQSLAGSTFRSRLKGNRKDCGCFESRDIGEYDTCPHGCVYCYAVQNRDIALSRYRQHDPASEFLFPPPSDVQDDSPSRDPKRQLTLFGGE